MRYETWAMTAVALLSFAGNSLLCRLALQTQEVDAGTFSAVRMASGMAALYFLLRRQGRVIPDDPNWISCFALAGYVLFFALAYTTIDAGVGALILFGFVQLTMIGWGLRQSESLSKKEIAGVVISFSGLALLTVPGKAAPDLLGSLSMAMAGIAWGIYSLRGRNETSPTSATTWNFFWGTMLILPLAGAYWLAKRPPPATPRGIMLASISGAITSGMGYAIWYRVLPRLKKTHAAVVQLLVPIVASIGAILFLGESFSLRLVACGAFVLGGVGLALKR